MYISIYSRWRAMSLFAFSRIWWCVKESFLFAQCVAITQIRRRYKYKKRTREKFSIYECIVNAEPTKVFAGGCQIRGCIALLVRRIECSELTPIIGWNVQ